MRGLLDHVDYYYDELLGYQSLEFSNLDAVKSFVNIKQSILGFKTISESWMIGEPNSLQTIKDILATVETWYKTDHDYEGDIEADIIAGYYATFFAKDARGFPSGLVQLNNLYPGRPATEDRDVFVTETGPQLIYLSDVARTIGQLLTFRDDIIEFFSVPLVEVGVAPGTYPSLRQYASMFSPPTSVPAGVDQRVLTPEGRLQATPAGVDSQNEQAIVISNMNSGKDPLTQFPAYTGGMSSRRPLYSNSLKKQSKTRRKRKSKRTSRTR